EEAIETVQIYSAMDEPEATWPVHTRPFRAPHHSASAASMAGGGRTIQAGEITLAHNGVLFLDELGEFPRDVLQVLRQPLESGVIHIARADYRYRFPARFALVAASNPCRCGNFGHPMAACRCSLQHIQQYRQKLSGPLMDRMDLHVELGWMSPETTMETAPGESSAAVRARVLAARARQVQRARGRGPLVNAALGPRLLKEWCAPTAEARQLLTSAITRHGFSARAHDRILRVARTIADLAGEDRIAAPQMAEAIQFRALDRPL
ncbi:MAG: ATP-binding protein, partial [Deltaproteobacteria bacterium]|nr:ATP-binding protein [Deltaproteobacteria bacterium]